MNHSNLSAVCYIRSDSRSDLRELQLNAIHSFAKENHVSHLKIFEDIDDASAPTLADALQFTENHGANFFILWRMDRAGDGGRSIENAVKMISNLGASDARFICLEDRLDSTQPAEVFLVSLSSAVSQAARLVKGERVSYALTVARNLGESVGRPTHRNDERILELREQGLSLREIAKETETSVWAVQRAIKNSPERITSMR